MKLAKALNYFDRSVTGEEGTAQIAEALKQQLAGKINDIMKNGYTSPTEKDRDGNPKVYTGQEAIDKFMEFAQADLAEKAKDMQMASWQNWDAAQAAKAAKEAAQAQAQAAGIIANVQNIINNMGGSSGGGFAGGGGSSYGTNPMQYMNLLAYNPSMHQGATSPGGMSSQTFLDYMNGKPLPASYQGPSLVAGSGYHMTEAEMIANVHSTYLFNPQAAQQLADYYGLNTSLVPNNYTLMGGGSGNGFDILVGDEAETQNLTAGQVGNTFSTAGYWCNTIGLGLSIAGFPEFGMPLMGVGIGMDMISAVANTVELIENPNINSFASAVGSYGSVIIDIVPFHIGQTSENVILKPQGFYNTITSTFLNQGQVQEMMFNEYFGSFVGFGWGTAFMALPYLQGTNTNQNMSGYSTQDNQMYWDVP
ncbi:MAG: hypothetical protein HPY53_14425 [Brevinematales bacterium]|nr:hypothetical protein [Brevinematales bacterium]